MSASDDNPHLAILLDVVIMGYSMVMGPIWNKGTSMQNFKPRAQQVLEKRHSLTRHAQLSHGRLGQG